MMQSLESHHPPANPLRRTRTECLEAALDDKLCVRPTLAADWNRNLTLQQIPAERLEEYVEQYFHFKPDQFRLATLQYYKENWESYRRNWSDFCPDPMNHPEEIYTIITVNIVGRMELKLRKDAPLNFGGGDGTDSRPNNNTVDSVVLRDLARQLYHFGSQLNQKQFQCLSFKLLGLINSKMAIYNKRRLIDSKGARTWADLHFGFEWFLNMLHNNPASRFRDYYVPGEIKIHNLVAKLDAKFPVSLPHIEAEFPSLKEIKEFWLKHHQPSKIPDGKRKVGDNDEFEDIDAEMEPEHEEEEEDEDAATIEELMEGAIADLADADDEQVLSAYQQTKEKEMQQNKTQNLTKSRKRKPPPAELPRDVHGRPFVPPLPTSDRFRGVNVGLVTKSAVLVFFRVFSTGIITCSKCQTQLQLREAFEEFLPRVKAISARLGLLQ